MNPISIPFARLDNPQTLNLYGYVGNNPLRYFDPYGHFKDCGGGGDPSVVCIVTTAIDKIKSWFSGSGSSSGNTQAATPAPSPDPQFRVTSTIRPAFRAPDFYSASLQLGYAAPSVSYMPSTKNYFAGPGGAGPHGVGLMFTAGWSKRPEDFLSGSSASGCAYAGLAVRGGSSLTSFAPTLQVGSTSDRRAAAYRVVITWTGIAIRNRSTNRCP